MKRQLKLTTIVIIIIATVIAFPFLNIKYFEIAPALNIVYQNFFVPIVIVAFIGTLFVYSKYLRKLNQKTTLKIKVAFQDIFTFTFLTAIVSAILVGLAFSIIITSNAYLKPRKIFTIKELVIAYEPYTTKWGRLRHYIKFISPIDNTIMHLEVYRKYEVGETFTKEMKIGKWGLLYSIN